MKFIVVGLGGTGSYLLNNLVNYLSIFKKVEHEIVLVDGDILEERNLLRQGFLAKDIGSHKVEALKKRFERILTDNITITIYPGFINRMKDLEDIVKGDTDVVIISCVDNNMARYRILMAQFKMYSENKGKNSLIFVDAGNEEWHGQVLVNYLKKGDAIPVEYVEGKFKYTGDVEGHYLSTIFDGRDDWVTTLSRGEHEISCDVITEVAPQNIVTNMTSASSIVYMLNKVLEKGYDNTRYQFNVKTGVQEEIKIKSNFNRIAEMVDYANGEGKQDLLGLREDVPVVGQTVEQQEEPQEEQEYVDLIEEEIAGDQEESQQQFQQSVGIEDLKAVLDPRNGHDVTRYLEGMGINTGSMELDN